MTDPELTVPQVSATWLVEQLDTRLDDRDTVLAFDGDGTLWSGDVSDDVFLAACREGWLLEGVRPSLAIQASALGIDTTGTASAIALRLFEAGQRGVLDECTLFATMTWCYAGRTVRELTEYAAKVLLQMSLPQRLRAEMSEVLQWARRRNVHCVVVSASPHPIVAWAAAHWGFSPELVIGTMPQIRAGTIVDQLLDPVPFAANKCTLLKRRFAGHRILACFGDSNFDFDLLECAEMAVAVAPKPSLYSSLLRLSRAVVLITGSFSG
jgi:phosphatidylglycerophosphatase C